mmetsp:Transcript_39371/g.34849  ORF Transcript_39371/g.34849 Transcript_39371/m.34849 type:complete len:101 (-) Transcript_39371:57-359(-)
MLSNHHPSSEYLTKENQRLEDQLYHGVQKLKEASLGLRRDIKKDKEGWERMSELFGNAGEMLNQSVKRFDVMKQTGGVNVTLYLACFMFFVLMLFYWIFF